MPTPRCSPTTGNPNYDFALAGESLNYGFLYASSPYDAWSEIPASSPPRQFKAEQKTWTSGRGRGSFGADPSGYFDAKDAWTMTDMCVYPTLQWDFAKGLRSANSSLPGPMTFVPMYGTTGTYRRYYSTDFTPAANYTAVNVFLWMKKTGTPGTLTAQVWTDTAGAPNALVANATATGRLRTPQPAL
jgi:hypothetical protein